MSTATYEALSEQEKREVSMFGCTKAQMKEAVEESLTFRYRGPTAMAINLMSDAQEEMEHGLKEDARQTLNRAKWILSAYTEDKE